MAVVVCNKAATLCELQSRRGTAGTQCFRRVGRCGAGDRDRKVGRHEEPRDDRQRPDGRLRPSALFAATVTAATETGILDLLC